jgi:hypothetical protein
VTATVHRFGDVVGDVEHGGIVDPGRAVLLEHIDTVAMRPQSLTPLGMLEHAPSIALRLEGRVNHTQERLDAVFLFAITDAPSLVGEILNAVVRAAGPEGLDKALAEAALIIARRRQ